MKTKFKELLDAPLNQGGFTLSSKILDLGRHAERVASICMENVDKDGRFARIHCSNIINWMAEIAEDAQVALDLQMKRDAR